MPSPKGVPFGLLQVAETLGLGPLHPESISPLARVEALLAELPPERTGTAAAQSAHRASAKWEEKFETVATWFEAGGAVEDLLRPLRTRKRRIEAVSTQLLPARRTFWAERCAWMAATLKEGPMKETAPGASLPLSLATWSAKASLTAYRLRDASQRRRWKPLNSASAFRSGLHLRLDQRDLRDRGFVDDLPPGS